MIFQGAPGAGKIALMQECMGAVRQHSTFDDQWVAVSIDPALGFKSNHCMMLKLIFGMFLDDIIGWT